jgi:thioredoxin 1
MTFEDLIQTDTPLLVDFYADWCGPCKTLSPIIQEIKNEMGAKIKVVKIDVDKNQSLSGKLDVRSIPTIMIYQNGEVKWRESGVQTKQAILSKLNSMMN